MSTQTTYNAAGKQFYVYHASAISSGYGHKKITVQLIEEFSSDSKEVWAITSFMPGYDAATDLDGQEKYEALYELISSKIEDEVYNWLDENA